MICVILVVMGGPLYLVDRQSYSNVLNWQQTVFESVKQGAHENNFKLHGKDCK
jgi:hypothetical protein